MKYQFLVPLLLSTILCVVFGTTIEPSFGSGSGNYNEGENVVMKCVITLEEGLELGYHQQWYKMQDEQENHVIVGQDKNALEAPFSLNENKYNVDYIYDRKVKVSTMELTITNVETVDIGDYKCVVGYTDDPTETTTESTVLKLRITPKEPSDLFFKTDAPSDGSVMLFNVAHPIDCMAEAVTLSPNLKLTIQLEDGTDISPDFTPASNVKWSGELGLKMPVSKLSLNDDQWMPETASANTMSCYFHDGDRQLSVQNFKYRRDETATINCSSNYKKAARVDDLAVYITCQVNDYSKELSDLAFKWVFLHESDKVVLNTGENKHLREASYVNGKFQLFIPRITREMVMHGKVSTYNVTLYSTDKEEAIAATTFGLSVDSTGRIENGAAGIYYSVSLLLVQFLALI